MTTTRWAVAAALVVSLAACQAPQRSAMPEQAARRVSAVRIELRPIAGGIVTSGVLIPRNQVQINPDLAGYRVSKLYVDEGEWVKAGEPLVEMDPSILKAQLDQQLALVRQSQATADQRDAEAARVVGLDKSGVLAAEQVSDRGFTAATARAGAKAQLAAADEMRTRLAHLTIRAPVSGQVIQRNVNLGDISGGGGANPWLVMAEDGQIELYADVAEADFGQVKPGLRARVTLADDKVVDGVVRLVSPRVDSTSRLGKVRISLPVEPDIRSGGYARASFTDLSRAVPALPETAVRYDANGASVMVVGADHRVSLVPVKTGERGGGWVELLSGPPPGALVVEKAGAQLLPGDYVKTDAERQGDKP